MPSDAGQIFVVALTRLEKIALECAARAVIDSAPDGSPGQSLPKALASLEGAKAYRLRPEPVTVPDEGSAD